MDRAANETDGRCRTCEGRSGVAVVYRWRHGRRRRLYLARCSCCGDRLLQTTAANLKRVRVVHLDPRFEEPLQPVRPSWIGARCTGRCREAG